MSRCSFPFRHFAMIVMLLPAAGAIAQEKQATSTFVPGEIAFGQGQVRTANGYFQPTGTRILRTLTNGVASDEPRFGLSLEAHRKHYRAGMMDNGDPDSWWFFAVDPSIRAEIDGGAKGTGLFDAKSFSRANAEIGGVGFAHIRGEMGDTDAQARMEAAAQAAYDAEEARLTALRDNRIAQGVPGAVAQSEFDKAMRKNQATLDATRQAAKRVRVAVATGDFQAIRGSLQSFRDNFAGESFDGLRVDFGKFSLEDGFRVSDIHMEVCAAIEPAALLLGHHTKDMVRKHVDPAVPAVKDSKGVIVTPAIPETTTYTQGPVALKNIVMNRGSVCAKVKSGQWGSLKIGASFVRESGSDISSKVIAPNVGYEKRLFGYKVGADYSLDSRFVGNGDAPSTVQREHRLSFTVGR